MTPLITDRFNHHVLGLAACVAITLAACSDTDDQSVEVSPGPEGALTTAAAPTGRDAEPPVNYPAEIYFDLTAFPWYREGRPLMHAGRPYMPQAEPTVVEVELSEAGRYEGVTYYVAEGSREPVYTLYVPVYYRYWQRFTSPPGS